MAEIDPKNVLAAALFAQSAPPQETLLTGFGLVEVRGAYFSGKTVTLDGYRFVECRFDACTLQASTGNFELVNTVIDPSCGSLYSHSLVKTLRLFLGRYEWARKTFPDVFLPVYGLNGAMTIV